MSDYLIYLIGHETARGLARPIKCGISRGPWGRIKALQTGSPQPLGMLSIFHVHDRGAALAIERDFHERAADVRMAGEWFDMNPTDAVALLCLCVADFYHGRLDEDAFHRRMVESGVYRAVERVQKNRGAIQ